MIKNIQPSMTGEKGTVLGITEVKPTVGWPGYKHCQGPIIHLDLFFIDKRMLPN